MLIFRVKDHDRLENTRSCKSTPVFDAWEHTSGSKSSILS